MPSRKKRGGWFCCCIGCQNNSQDSPIDPRTGLKYKFHGFPTSDKDLARRKKWLQNIRRADMKLDDIGTKKVCSAHFEPTAYNNPTEFGTSSLKNSAVPTIISCPNPPPSAACKRRLLTRHKDVVPKRRRTKAPVEAPNVVEHETVQETFSMEQEPVNEVSHLRHQMEETLSELKKKTKLLSSVQLLLTSERQKNRILRQKLKRREEAVKKKDIELGKLMQKIVHERKTSKDNHLKTLPKIPRALVEVMLLGSKRVNWANHDETLELALTVFFRSPAAYEQLRIAGFQLPCTRTLRNRYSEVLQAPGFCPRLIEMISLRAKDMVGHEKFVTLSLDGMRLSTGLTYKKHSDTIIGFEDLGNHGKSLKIANEGVVVMVRGVTRRWKQIIGYFVTDSCIKADQLDGILEEAAALLSKCGLHVVMTLMDQGTTQWKWVKERGIKPESPSTSIGGQETFVMPDPPHLLKNIRNHFMKKQIKFTWKNETHTADWKYIKSTWQLENQHPTRLIPKWKKDHIAPSRGKKMKVCLAAQVLSHTASSGMRTYIRFQELPPDAEGTALFLEITNKLWDLLNSSNFIHAIKRNNWTECLGKLEELIDFVDSWKFIVKRGKKRRAPLPFHHGLKLALAAIRGFCVKYMMEQASLDFVFTRRFNQDHVENLHSVIRGSQGHNAHPNVPSYANALRGIACMYLTSELVQTSHSSGANCEDLSWETDLQLQQPPKGSADETAEEEGEEDVESEDEEEEKGGIEWEEWDEWPEEGLGGEEEGAKQPNVISELCLTAIEREAMTYIAGAAVNSLRQKKGQCEECLSLLADPDAPPAVFTSLKEYKEGALVNTSIPLRQLADAFEVHFKSSIDNALVCEHPRTTILTSFIYDFSDFKCSSHSNSIAHDFLHYVCTTRIFHCTTLINEELHSKTKGSELTKWRRLNV